MTHDSELVGGCAAGLEGSERIDLTKLIDPETIRICPMRDGPCPHGLHCQFVGEGAYGYPCKEGWRAPAGLKALEKASE